MYLIAFTVVATITLLMLKIILFQSMPAIVVAIPVIAYISFVAIMYTLIFIIFFKFKWKNPKEWDAIVLLSNAAKKERKKERNEQRKSN